MKKLNKNSASLLLTSAINNVIALFINYFLVAYLLNISSQNISNVAIFYLINFVTLGSVYFCLSSILEKYNKLIVYRIGIVLKVIFVCLVMLLREKIVDLLILIALFSGSAEAFYWSSFNAMRNEIIEPNFFQKYISMNTITNQIISIVFPFLLGSAIDISSFEKVAVIIFCLAIIQLFASLQITNQRTYGSFELKKFFLIMKKTNSKKLFFLMYFSYFLGGLRYCINSLVVYMIILTYQTNTNLGILTSVFAFCSILVMIFFSRWYKPKKDSWIILLVLGLVLISMTGIIIDINKATVAIFNGVYTTLMMIPVSLLEMRRNTLVKDLNMHEFIVENMSVSETFLNSGKMFSFTALLIVGIINTRLALVTLFILIAIFITILLILIYLLEINLKKHDINN